MEFNGIGETAGQGYQIKLNSDQQLTIFGERLLPDINIRLEFNCIFKTISCRCSCCLPRNAFKCSLVIVDSEGNAYLPEWAFNGIGDMYSGKAYQIKPIFIH